MTNPYLKATAYPAASTTRPGLLGRADASSPHHQFNLAEMGRAWHENVEAKPEFAQFVEHIKQEIRGS